MKYLLLWLEGPLQSWGSDSRFDLRRTEKFPTKSAVYGMLLASSGDSGPQEELLARMAPCPFDVIVFAASTGLLQDFHMVGNGYDDKDDWQVLLIPHKSDHKPRTSPGGGTKTTYREYLQDRCFAVIAGLPDDLAGKFSASMAMPVFDLYLGRKCCVPSAPIFRGCFDSAKEALAYLEKTLLLGREKAVKSEKTIRSVPDGSNPRARLINDVPVRFGTHKLYRDRWIVEEEVPAEQDDHV